jgi:hypothetical protein
MEISKFELIVGSTLKKVSNNSKKEGEGGSPCLTPLLHGKSFPAIPLSKTEEVADESREEIH